MPVTADQARMLATLAVAARPHGAPRWDAAGVYHAIGKVKDCALADVTCAVMRAASDRDAQTPGVIAATGSLHWREKVAPSTTRTPAKAGGDCRFHPGEWADGCRMCAADRAVGDDPAEAAPARPAADWSARVAATRALVQPLRPLREPQEQA